MLPTRFSVLDRSLTRQGQTEAQSLRDTVRFAQQAEALGYHRFWVSEHHSVPGVAGSAPTVLAAAVAAATSHIRVGTGGVMLPNHRPLVVAEQFGVLSALFPNRIDMGLGRSVGFTTGIRRALGADKDAVERFGAHLTELLGYFTGDQDHHPGVHAHPAEGLRVPPFVLANGPAADHAADLGLPLVIAVHGGDRWLQALDRYRTRFRPSTWSPRPYVIAAVTAAVGETPQQAQRLLASEAWSTAYSRTHGEFPPLRPADEVLALDMSARERAFFEEALAGQVHGTEDEVAATLDTLATRGEVDEFLIGMSTYDRAEMLDSYRRLAHAVGLTNPARQERATAHV
ncbi:luciferase family oxidoreductase, group 1 [Streptoalloteichus tenebrarius]|uniref:Luciferase family oxidoreductase, group 1 n=1 Tax=Streptoalloteichus tenebrarius (strain ATCC 17920 / DSM 40477 / JCM 4838 / CBS 697.72 / NBRC 16177 / NCIMB 11028 / NRRL B-12390 / A12253. 1 / ISP 5477) TaxID=1933 RepID=A0ABT1HQB4_STRSD|nr:LLM class flavin-dependent oxidoreductase [Streptoalloteichus tenebrarius]MCP2257645.1 luciferase family oxidoreductase, group 1 [Streptoalloteichus tenebrarius]BFE98605.1 LLM class flavin-dependent oxidoreductase [Streptoalloteichus tenebrarius]